MGVSEKESIEEGERPGCPKGATTDENVQTAQSGPVCQEAKPARYSQQSGP